MRGRILNTLIFIVALSGLGNAQVVVSEIISSNEIELKNIGTDTISVDTFWLCNRPNYEIIGGLNVECGNFNMAPGSILVVNTTSITMDGPGGEMGIFTNGDFADPQSIMDYVIWGSPSGVNRESTAVSAGIWTEFDRAPAFDSLTSLYYDGSGDRASDYLIGVSTSCIDELPDPPCEVLGGSVVLSDSTTMTTICVDDDIEELIEVSLSDAVGTNSAWVVTDTNLTILAIDTTNVFNLEPAGAGVCLIWHLSFEDGLEGAAIDSNAANLSGCFDLSNPITVTRLAGADCPAPPCAVEGGSVLITGDSTTMTTICVDDDAVELVDVSLSGASGSNSAWVITDTNLTILGIDTTNVFNLEPAGAGVCLIWHLSFEDGLEGAAIDSNAANLSGCFDLSNPITVTRLAGADCPTPPCAVEGGSVLIAGDSTTMTTICVDDDAVELVDVSLSGSSGSNSAWVITDTNLTILGIDTTNVFNLEPAGAGVCLIWHLSFEDGLEGAAIDSNAANLSGCFDLSNPITVTRLAGADCPTPPCAVEGGSVLIAGDSTTMTTICVDDDAVELVDVSLSGASGSNSAWVITDTNLTILGIDTTNVFNLEPAGAGVCLIWHLSFEDGLQGAVIDSNAANLSGCFDLSNPITVTRLAGADCPMEVCEVEGGSVVIRGDSTTMTTICVDDGVEEIVEVSLSGAIGSNSAWVITDTSLNILGIETTPVFNLEPAGAGVCLIWHLSFEDGLEGAVIDSNAANLNGCFDLSNPVTVTRLAGADCPMEVCEVEGGTVVIRGDTTTMTTICVDDDVEEIVEVSLSGASGSNSAWVITDTSLNILGIETTPVFNLEPAGVGVCLIWHLSFEPGLQGASIGSNAGDLSGCFDLSNPVTVNRIGGEDCNVMTCEVSGGDILITGDSTTMATICVDDDQVELVDVSLSGASGSNSAWVITDTNLTILGIDTTNVFNLEPAGAGVCLIWHLSFEDGLEGAVIDSNAANLNGCFDLSNPITVTRLAGADCPAPPCEVSGGEIVITGDTTTMTTICVDDDAVELVDVSLSGASGSNSAWVITDTNLTILGIDTTNVFNLEPAGAGVCLIWHLSFEDGLEGAVIDSNAANLSGCFDLSNPITVTRLAGADCPTPPCDVSGGEISISGDSSTMTTICVDDDVAELVDVSLTGASGSNSAWVVTDTNLTILAIDTTNVFDLEAAGAGVCLIWHLSFEDGLEGVTIDSSAANLNGCFDLSNPITVTRVGGEDCPNPGCQVQGGSLTLADGGTEIFLCGEQGGEGSFNVVLDGVVGTRTAWIITDTTGAILGFPLAPPFNLTGARPGIYQIWHVVFEDQLQGASLGGNANNITGCFALSNPITVNRVDLEAPSIAFEDGSQVTSLCLNGDSASLDIATVEAGVGGQMGYIVTDEDGQILGLPGTSTIDFSTAGSGVCLVWAYVSAGDLEGAEVGNNASDISGCFALSNPITVIRNEVSAATLFTEIGTATVTICVGDDHADILDLVVQGGSGANKQYIVTDTAGIILELSDDLDIDFDGAGEGTCFIWLINYSDSLSGLDIGASATDITGCFALSNPIELIRTTGEDCPEPCDKEGGMIATLDGDTEITICTDDGLSDAFELVVTGNSGENSAWIVADLEGNILGIRSTFGADLDGTGEGQLVVRHISYADDAMIPEDGGNINTLTGCFDLSNVFTINRVIGEECSGICAVDGGNLTTDFGTEITICADDGESDAFDVTLSEVVGENRVFVITDAAANILSITESGPFDFEGTGSGAAQLWHLAYTGSLSGASVGGNASDLEGCFDLSNPILIERQVGNDCPGSCITDGGTISFADGSDAASFCAGEVRFSVMHDTEATEEGLSYYYVVTDEDNEILEWRNSEDGDEFNFDRAPAGTCYIYGFSTEDPSVLEEDIDIDDLLEGCSVLSTNRLTVTREKGGVCDEGCHTPRDIRIRSNGQNKWTVVWDRVNDASSYIILLGYEGAPNSFTEVPVRRNRIKLSGPSNRVMVVRVKAVCGINETSEFSEEFILRINEDNGVVSASSRSEVLSGKVLPNGIVISEQALAFPNPASDQVNIWYEDKEVMGRVTLFNQTGQKILEQQLPTNQPYHQLDISQLKGGLYFIRVDRAGEMIMQDKLIIAQP